jgi:aromatic-L-amino-acid decarboxylase
MSTENPLPTPSDGLELGGDQMCAFVDLAMQRILVHLETLSTQAVSDISGGEELARSLVEGMPEQGASYAGLLDLLFQKLLPKTYNTASGGYLAYIPGGGIFPSAVADLIADSVNRYVGVWTAAPGLAQLEANVLRWFCDMVGYPMAARGLLTTGGSLANFTAIVTARRSRLSENFFPGTLYASDQVHHSIMKAALMAGFPVSHVREIPVDDHFRIRLDALQEKIDRDRAAGFQPFLVVASSGTTNTGAVDDLQALADLTQRENLWLHVDAAYGGFFMLTERGRAAMRGIDRADSITLDPHKALFLPYGTGSLLVRDGEALKRAHTVHAEYMPPMQDDPDLVDFCLYSPELSRDFRGLRVWLPLKLHGVSTFRRALDEKLDLARWVTEELRSIPGMEIAAEPQLSLVAFRLTRPGMPESELNEMNRRVLEAVNARQRVFLTATVLKGKFVMRICVLHFRTHGDLMQAAMEDINAAVARYAH